MFSDRPIRRSSVPGALASALVLALGLALWTAPATAYAAAGRQQEQAQQEEPTQPTGWPLPVAIAASIGVSCLAAAYAVGRVGSAAMGAASERPELLTRTLLFVALAEGIAIYGLLVAILLWLKL